MQIIRYQMGAEARYGWLDGQKVGELLGDPYGEFTRSSAATDVAGITLLAPCEPTKIIGVGNNFTDRLRERGQPPPELPQIYLKPPSAVIGPGAAICLPPQTQEVEFAAEIAVVIGKRARNVTPEDAAHYVLGYTCANDITARDLIAQTGSWTHGKSFDTFCPLGPCISTDVDPADLMIVGRVNGETRQMNSSRDLLFGLPQLVAFISSIMTLLPGDIILSGTPAGAGLLQPGDIVEIEIEGIGCLRNPVQSSA